MPTQFALWYAHEGAEAWVGRNAPKTECEGGRGTMEAGPSGGVGRDGGEKGKRGMSGGGQDGGRKSGGARNLGMHVQALKVS